MMRSTLFKSLLLTAALAIAPFSRAQPAAGGPGGAPPDFAAMRTQFAQRMKEMLGASDEDWKVLQPAIDKVQQLQRDAGGMRGRGGFGGPGGPGGPGGAPGSDQPQSPAQKAASDLQAAIDNEKSSADELKAKLKALREARAAAKVELGKAQEELRGLLSARQEATVVLMGMLD